MTARWITARIKAGRDTCIPCGIGRHSHATGTRCPKEAYIEPRPDWPTRHQPEAGVWIPCACRRDRRRREG